MKGYTVGGRHAEETTKTSFHIQKRDLELIIGASESKLRYGNVGFQIYLPKLDEIASSRIYRVLSIGIDFLKVGLPGGQTLSGVRTSRFHPLIPFHQPYGAKSDFSVMI